MTTPEPWPAHPGEPAFRPPQQAFDEAPLFPQNEHPPANPPQPYPQPGHPQAPYVQAQHSQPVYPEPLHPQPVYGQPAYPPAVYTQQFASPAQYAPFGVHPVSGQPLSDKTKVAAGLLSIFLGFFGAGRFYAGNTGLGLAQLLINIVLTLITFGLWLSVAWIWPLIDGIVLLTGSPRDGVGRLLR